MGHESILLEIIVSPEQRIHLLDYMLQLKVGILRRQFKLQNQAIDLQMHKPNDYLAKIALNSFTHLIDAHSDGLALLNRMFQQALRVEHNTLCGVNK